MYNSLKIYYILNLKHHGKIHEFVIDQVLKNSKITIN